jgi:hypothetical protein
VITNTKEEAEKKRYQFLTKPWLENEKDVKEAWKTIPYSSISLEIRSGWGENYKVKLDKGTIETPRGHS